MRANPRFSTDVTACRLNRRGFLLGSAGAIAGAGLAGTLVLPKESAAHGGPLPEPKPIPGGTPVGLQPPYDFIHWFGPGPEGKELPFTRVVLEGLNVEPATITDFRGFNALAYLAGKAKGSDGETYDLEADIRIMDGLYVASNGKRRQGTFALV